MPTTSRLRRALLFCGVSAAFGAAAWALLCLLFGSPSEIVLATTFGGVFWACVGFFLGLLSPSARDRTLQSMTVTEWFRRGIVGFLLGYVWTCLVSLVWAGLAMAVHGSFDKALEVMKLNPWNQTAFASCLTSMAASFFGGLIGPLALGSLSTGARPPLLRNSALGGGLGAGLGAIVGAVTGWLFWEHDPRSTSWMWVAVGLSLPIGVIGGWLGGRGAGAALSRREGS
jgi:hypothetical protein